MPSSFVVRSFNPNNGIIQLHLSREEGGPNEAYFNVTKEVLADIFTTAIHEGDIWELHAKFVGRVGSNGKKRI